MAHVWQCDRCGAISDETVAANMKGPEHPDGWRTMSVPMRGSRGDFTGDTIIEICGECDKSLYRWFNEPKESKGNVAVAV